MKPEQELKFESPKMPHAYIEFGGPGHETEYVFTIHPTKYSEAQNLPFELEESLTKTLGDGWSIMNRRYRIEIIPPNSKRTSESDAKLRKAIEDIIGSNHKLELKV